MKQSDDQSNITLYHALRLAYVAGQEGEDWMDVLDVLRDLAEDTRTFPKREHTGTLAELRQKIQELCALLPFTTPEMVEEQPFQGILKNSNLSDWRREKK